MKTNKLTAATVEMLKDSDGQERKRYDLCLGDLHMDEGREDGILMHETPEKFLRGDALFARTGVQLYGDASGNTWGEFRDAAEVFDEVSLRSYDLAVVTNDHPEEFVNADNRAELDVGSIGTDARPDSGKFVRASLVIRDKAAIADVRAGKCQLSMGYTATILVQAGVTDDGTPFAGRQTNIRINHGAIVQLGRAGPECGMKLARGDAFTLTPKVTMKTKKIKLDDGKEVEVSAQLVDAFLEARKADKDGPVAKALYIAICEDAGFPFKKKGEEEDDDDDDDAQDAAIAAKAKADADAAAAKKKADDKKAEDAKSDAEKLSALQAKVDVLEADGSTFNARVDTRSKLVADAMRVGVDASNRSDADIMRDVVLKVLPSMKEKLDAHKTDAGYLTCAYDQAMELASKRDEADLENNSVIFDAMKNDAGVLDFESAMSGYNDRATPGEA